MAMAPSQWTDARLTRLFERYRQRYWPTSRQLKAYRMQASSLSEAYGQCDSEARVLLIDVARHPSDREVGATVLHEMIHAAVGRVTRIHGAAFWAELERLLARRAPVTVGFLNSASMGSTWASSRDASDRAVACFDPSMNGSNARSTGSSCAGTQRR